jgi:hypothetical protein
LPPKDNDQVFNNQLLPTTTSLELSRAMLRFSLSSFQTALGLFSSSHPWDDGDSGLRARRFETPKATASDSISSETRDKNIEGPLRSRQSG